MIDSAVILAVSSSGKNSNLRDQRPRAMLPALGKPMVVRVMDRLYRAGIRRYLVIVGINEGPIASYINKQWMPDATVDFILQSNETLSLILSRIARQVDNPFLLVGYNSFTIERFTHTLFRQHDTYPDHLVVAGAGLTLSPDAPNNRYATMAGNTIGEIVSQKPGTSHLVLTEHAVCGYDFVTHMKNLDEATASRYGKTWFDIIQSYYNAEDSKVAVAETSWILRVESDHDLLTLNKRLLDDSHDGHVLSELPYSVKIIPPVRIDPQVSVGQSVVIGPHVYIERGSSVGYGAKLKNTVVLERASVPADSNLDGAIVTRRGVLNI
ncbi:MAG: NDP-sugar synthase [Chloroflexota bacterium]